MILLIMGADKWRSKMQILNEAVYLDFTTFCVALKTGLEVNRYFEDSST